MEKAEMKLLPLTLYENALKIDNHVDLRLLTSMHREIASTHKNRQGLSEKDSISS